MAFRGGISRSKFNGGLGRRLNISPFSGVKWKVRVLPPLPGINSRLTSNAGFTRLTTYGKTAFFQTDTVTHRVGNAAYRAVRRMAFDIRKVSRNSMKKGKRYRSEGQMPPEALKRYKKARRRWHQRGNQGPGPLLPMKPSKPGSPPNYIEGFIRNPPFGVWAEPVPSPGRISFNVGPLPAPGIRSNNALRVLALHEHGGVGVGSEGGVAQFPKRPYMRPAYNKRIGKLPQFLAEAIRQDLARR